VICYKAVVKQIIIYCNGLTSRSVISNLASYLDLNTLSELARTCRQARENLLQHRSILISRTLRCGNRNADLGKRLGDALSASRDAWIAYGRSEVRIGRITSGKVGACATDMVGDCRKCGRVVCRVCLASSDRMMLTETHTMHRTVL
jgi:hypothetical protein